MPANFIVSIEDIGEEAFEDENGATFVVFQISYKKKKNRLKRVMIDALEIVSETAVIAYTWKSNFHPAWPLVVSAMGAVSVTDFYINARKYIRKLSRLQRDRLRLKWYLATGVVAYFTAIHAFSEALKRNNYVWILCFGVATSGYHLAASSVTRLGRTVSNRSPFMKCCQLLFGPTLIRCAAYYLLSFRQHDEEWLICLPMIASAVVANHIAIVGYRRVESDTEPRWLLFKGLELLVGGCLLIINGSMLVAYSVNNQFHPLFITFCTTMVMNGFTDIHESLESFQGCVEMEAPVYYCICGMMGGPIMFLSACLCIRCIRHLITLPAFLVTAGTALAILGKSVMDLHHLVPRPVFKRYCQRVLGPVVTVYSSLFAGYVGYHMGWRFSLVMMPFIPAGIYATYEGFRRRNQPR